jgi:organic radical activating enzyme
MTFNLESFCPEAWSQIEIDAEGDFKICCLANFDDDFGMARDDSNRVMNITTDSIEDALNSKTHREHRLEMMQNIKPTRCRSCYDSEDSTKIPEWGSSSSNGRSKRQRVINETAKMIPEYVTVNTASKFTSSDGTVTSKIVNLDLRFGNLCNQKCIMCSPQHSSLWYEDWKIISQGKSDYNREPGVYKKGKYKIYPLVEDDRGRTRMSGVIPWWETDDWWKKFDKISPDLRYIYFTGGEPLLVPAMEECLDRLISNRHAEKIQLRFDTNLSVINKKVIDKWKHFKELHLCVSVDDVADRYNLIRNPGNYERFIENIKTIKENQIPIHYFSSCIGIATPYAVKRVLDLAEDFNVDTYFRFLEGPNWLDIRNFPRSAKLEIIKTIESFGGNKRYLRWYKAEINLLKKYIDYENQEHIQEFVRVMDILDNSRNTDWRKTLSDVYDLIQRHCKVVKV